MESAALHTGWLVIESYFVDAWLRQLSQLKNVNNGHNKVRNSFVKVPKANIGGTFDFEVFCPRNAQLDGFNNPISKARSNTLAMKLLQPNFQIRANLISLRFGPKKGNSLHWLLIIVRSNVS